MAPDIPAESNPVQRIDHVAAVVEDFQVARRFWIEVGGPVVYDGSMEHPGTPASDHLAAAVPGVRFVS